VISIRLITLYAFQAVFFHVPVKTMLGIGAADFRIMAGYPGNDYRVPFLFGQNLKGFIRGYEFGLTRIHHALSEVIKEHGSGRRIVLIHPHTHALAYGNGRGLPDVFFSLFLVDLYRL
jgi:hypothetical protein